MKTEEEANMKSTINSPMVNVVIQLFNQLGKVDRMKVAERIGKQTLAERWDGYGCRIAG